MSSPIPEETPIEKKPVDQVESNEDAPKSGESAESPKEKFSVFVGGLPWSVDDERLREEFAHIGEIVGARVVTDRSSGRSKGFGYVDFPTKDLAQKAVDEMNRFELEGRSLNVDMSLPREPRKSDTLFLGNLSFEVQEDAIRDLIEPTGLTIVSLRIPTDRVSGRPKGFGYVQFESIADAEKAFEELKEKSLDSRKLRVDFSAPRDDSRRDRGGRDFRGGRDNYRSGGRDGYRSGGRDGYRSGGRDNRDGGRGYRDRDDRRRDRY